MLEYVKGQGWVEESQDVVTMKCGRRVRLEFRKPKRGEYYDVGNRDTIWRQVMENLQYRWLLESSNGEDASGGNLDGNYCVAIPIDL